MTGNVIRETSSIFVTNSFNMPASRRISSWAILLQIQTGTCKLMIMESLHGNASHITGHPWGESTGHQWTTSQRSSYVLHGPWKNYWPNSRVVHDFETPPHSCHVIVMVHELDLCGQCCDLIAIQLCITSVYNIMRPACTFRVRKAEYICASLYIA